MYNKTIKFNALTTDNRVYSFFFTENLYNNVFKLFNLDANVVPSWDAVLIMFKTTSIDYDIPTVASVNEPPFRSLRLAVEDFVWQQLTTKYPLVNFIGARLTAKLI